MQQAPPTYNAAMGGASAVPQTNPSDPNYAGGAPTAHPAPPPRSRATHGVVGDWQTSCLGVCCYDPGLCLYAQICLPCLVVSQRVELMRTHSPPETEYTCCMNKVGGQWFTDHCQCCGCGPHPINSTAGTCCLCCEALCCFFMSIPAHRRSIQEQFGVAEGKEEWGAHVVGCISFIPVFGLAGGFLIGWVACCFYACLAAQCEVEIRARAGPVKQTMM